MAASTIPYRSQNNRSGASFAGVGRFFRWWRDELASLIPAALLPYPRAAGKYLWAEFEADGIVLRVARGGQLADAGKVALSARDEDSNKLAFNALYGKSRRPALGLSIPSERILRKTIELPLAVKENLRPALAFELNRQTPFNADQAYFDYRVRAIRPKAGQIQVELIVSDRRQIDRELAMLAKWGHPCQVVAPTDELAGEPRYANLLPPEARARTTLATKWRYAGMALITIALLGATLAIPLWQKRAAVIVLNGEAANMKQQAQAVDDLQHSLAKASAEYQYLLERKFKRPAKVALVEEVTRLLPDDTWLSSLEVKANEVVLNGETNSSTKLIRLMEGSSLIQDAAFNSPVVKDRNNNLERFRLSAKIKETSAAEALGQQMQTPKQPATTRKTGGQR